MCRVLSFINLFNPLGVTDKETEAQKGLPKVYGQEVAELGLESKLRAPVSLEIVRFPQDLYCGPRWSELPGPSPVFAQQFRAPGTLLIHIISLDPRGLLRRV